MNDLQDKLNKTYNLNRVENVVHLDSNYHGKVFCIPLYKSNSSGEILVTGHDIVERIKWAEERRDEAALAVKNLYAIISGDQHE